jgi:predicted methyltransferase
MKIMAVLIIVVALVSGANASDNASNSAAATMAVADPSRPDSDTTRDADRKPAQTLVFVGIKSGDKVADYAWAGLVPGRGGVADLHAVAH